MQPLVLLLSACRKAIPETIRYRVHIAALHCSIEKILNHTNLLQMPR